MMDKVINLKPNHAARRKMSVADFDILTKSKPPKKLVRALKRNAGRDQTGQISVRHKGGGAKRNYRDISKLDQFLGSSAQVEAIHYDPNRSAYLAMIKFADKTHSYILAWQGAKIGDKVVAEEKTEIQPGCRMRLANIPNGIGIYDIEMQPGQGGKLVRSAGATAAITAKEGAWVHLKMPSGEIRKINKNCFASIGQVSNAAHSLIRIGNAGRKRHMGIRPSVRGKAMHPDAHPHGGGEGVNPIGLKYPKTPWGKHALGVKTRKKNKYSSRMIIKRRKK